MSSSAQAEAIDPFWEALRGTERRQAQSRLLNTADRDLAALLSAAGDSEREEVFALLSPTKTARLKDELLRMAHVKLAPETLGRIARHLAAHVSGDRSLGPASRYFKPAR